MYQRMAWIKDKTINFRGFAAASGYGTTNSYNKVEPYLLEAIKDAIDLAHLAYQYPERATQGILAAMGLQNIGGASYAPTHAAPAAPYHAWIKEQKSG